MCKIIIRQFIFIAMCSSIARVAAAEEPLHGWPKCNKGHQENLIQFENQEIDYGSI